MAASTEPTLDAAVVNGATDLLAAHRRSGERLAALPEAVRPATLADGYAVQSALVERLVAERGDRSIGY